MGIGASLRLDNIKVSLTKIQLFDFIDKIKECLNWLYITKKKKYTYFIYSVGTELSFGNEVV